jgi:hypothetical protein
LRKPESPQDPSNRRISLIVQYHQKPVENAVPAASTEGGTEKVKPAEGKVTEVQTEPGAKKEVGESTSAKPGNQQKKK